MDELVKYIIAIAKLQSDEEATKNIEKSIKDLINAELDACLVICAEQDKEWNETARNSKWTVRDIATKIKARIKT